MQVKILYITILFQITVLCSWAQNIDDVFERGIPTTKNEGTTMDVDTDIPQGKTQEELAREQDSIKVKQLNDEWNTFLSEKNKEIQQLYEEIQQIDSNNITDEEIDRYEGLVSCIERDFNNKKESDGLWQRNDELNKLRTEFENNCEKVSKELNRMKEKVKQKKGEDHPYKNLIVIGICLLGVMAVVPIFMQIKSGFMMGKAKKEQKKQEREAKRQMEKINDQMLLADENNIITLRE